MHNQAPPPGAFTCCISTSKGSNNDLSYQQTFRLSETTRHDDSPIATTASALEEAICSRLSSQDATKDTDGEDRGRNEEEDFDPVQIVESDDAHLLRCRPLLSSDGEEPAATIFGINESAFSLGGMSQDGKARVSDGDIPVYVTILEPSCNDIYNGSNREGKQHPKACCCHHPRGLNDCRTQNQHPKVSPNRDTSPTSSYHANVKIVDLTKIQDRRRGIETDESSYYPCFDTPGKVFHLLRSVLNGPSGGLHCASPWNQLYCSDKIIPDSDTSGGNHCAVDQVVALLVKAPNQTRRNTNGNANDQFWDGIEQNEVNELLKFRIGDPAPSHFLHSTSQLSGGKPLDLITTLNDSTPIGRKESLCVNCVSSDTLLFVYRHLPPRDFLSRRRIGQDEKYVGCLWETYLEDATKETELDIGLDQPAETNAPVMKHRMVSPPYQSNAQAYPGLLDTLLKRIDILQQEARTIPQWTAWPEQNHYADNSWNVFPLCYTFPSNDVSQRKFIDKTCSFVPETTKLLHTLGPALRTALFSRLDPRAKLGTHTGWADLANHVLRVHIPLIVPGGKSASKNQRKDDNYNTGLCGTWVDGCVETHEEGRVICFDDSKVHRAFNYSEEERVVLILDLARPQSLPMGTATGGHSDELDAFINGF